MNSVIRAACRLNAFNKFSMPIKRQFTRNLWHLSKQHNQASAFSGSFLNIHKPSLNCKCGCGIHLVHTKGEKELVEFLTEEIVAEKKARAPKPIASELDGFQVKLDGAEVELHKSNDKEKIVISFNINHTVDTENEPEAEPNAEKPEFAEMKSKPTFEVDIIKSGETLSFTCSFLQGVAEEGEYNDVFGIDEVTLYSGEWNDKKYAVAGDVLDGYLYDLLMNLLEEKGISNDFAEKLSELSTCYEHSAYIALLESISKFTVGK